MHAEGTDKNRTPSRRFAVAIAVWALTLPATLSANLIPNGTFDSDVAGWQPNAPLPPDTSFYWDGAMGLPPGSAALDSSFNGNARVRVSGPCFPAAGEGVYRFVADFYAEFGGCTLFLREHHDSADCTGTIDPSQSFPPYCIEDPTVECPPFFLDAWNHIDTLFYAGPEVQAFQLQLAVFRSSGYTGTARCRLDNLALFTPAQTGVAVPALGPAGMVTLVILLSLAAIRVLRGRRGC